MVSYRLGFCCKVLSPLLHGVTGLQHNPIDRPTYVRGFPRFSGSEQGEKYRNFQVILVGQSPNLNMSERTNIGRSVEV